MVRGLSAGGFGGARRNFDPLMVMAWLDDRAGGGGDRIALRHEIQWSGVVGVVGLGVQDCLFGGGGLIQAWVGFAGGVGTLLTKRAGLSA